MMDYAAMGKRMRKLRLLLKRTQASIAKECGLSPSFYGHLERGTRKASLETLLRVSIVLDTSTDFLLKGKETVRHCSADLLDKEDIARRMASILMEHMEDWMNDD